MNNHNRGTASMRETAMVDDNEFFRDATLSICGSLEIEEAMCACVRAMQGFLPVDRMFLQVYEPELGAMRTVATATAEDGEKVDLLTPLAEQTRERIRQRAAAGQEDVVVIDSEERNPVAREMLSFHGIQGSSILRMRLATEGGRFGGVVLTAEGADRYAVEHARLLRLLEDPFTIALANTLVHREVLLLRDRLADDNRYLHRELLRISGDEIVGADFGLREVMQQVRQVAPTESPVLLTGETGVGKDVIANAIHLGSPRRDGPFIPVNCGAIPESLLDSELFGHEKGAFTGADSRRMGRFEQADGGTLFLDEIGELPEMVQAKLLRVLEERMVERVGGSTPVRVDIRLVAATNRELEREVEIGRFREDLFYRLNVMRLTLGPLRDRPGDLELLTAALLETLTSRLGIPAKPLSKETMNRLKAHTWPGNVRELRNVLERALIVATGEEISPADLPDFGGPIARPAVTAPTPVSLIDRERRAILEALEQTGGHREKAAQLLGVSVRTLYSRLKEYDIR